MGQVNLKVMVHPNGKLCLHGDPDTRFDLLWLGEPWTTFLAGNAMVEEYGPGIYNLKGEELQEAFEAVGMLGINQAYHIEQVAGRHEDAVDVHNVQSIHITPEGYERRYIHDRLSATVEQFACHSDCHALPSGWSAAMKPVQMLVPMPLENINVVLQI